MSIENENQTFSLASIAGLDASDIAELRATSLPPGLYVFEGVSGKLEVREKDDGTTQVLARIKLTVVEAKGILDKDINPDDLVGKGFTQTKYMDPTDAEQGIGYLKGFIGDIGLDSSGPMGGCNDDEGNQILGFLDLVEGHRFEAKLVSQKGRDGVERVQLVPLKQRK